MSLSQFSDLIDVEASRKDFRLIITKLVLEMENTDIVHACTL